MKKLICKLLGGHTPVYIGEIVTLGGVLHMSFCSCGKVLLSQTSPQTRSREMEWDDRKSFWRRLWCNIIGHWGWVVWGEDDENGNLVHKCSFCHTWQEPKEPNV